MAFIYKITNNINQKVYIGKTVRTVDIRWKQHLQRGRELFRKEHLYRAMRKYGINNFSVETLEECPDDLRYERESYYICLYNSLEPLGYNYLLYQNGTYPNEKIEEVVLQEWLQGMLMCHISEKLHISVKKISEILKKHNITNEEIQKRKSAYIGEKSSKSVNQYNLSGDFIRQWVSASVAGRELRINCASISKNCCGDLLSYKGFIWQYEELDNIEDIIEKMKTIKKTGKNKKAIIQLDKNREFIQEFESASAAGRFLGKAHAGIAYAARTGGTAYGFYWKYKEEAI